jgi:hypothetical protein
MKHDCPNHTTANINDGERIATMHFCDGIEISRHDSEIIENYKKSLIKQTEEWGVVTNEDGSKSIRLRLDFAGSVYNSIIEETRCKECGEEFEPQDTWGIKESARLYKEGREAWLRGDFETVAELFGVLV